MLPNQPRLQLLRMLARTSHLPKVSRLCSITCFSSRSYVDEKAAKVNACINLMFSFTFILLNPLRQSSMLPIPPRCPSNTHNVYVVREAGPRGQAARLLICRATLCVCAL